MTQSAPRFAVVGGGLAGLMTVIKIAERGHPVDVFSVVPVKRSHSVCAQGGINAAVNIKGENDSPEIHFYDTVKGGDFLAHQPLCKGMAYAAPGLVYLLDRMGVPFSRTPEGNLDFRRFGGTLHHRTAFAGASTGQQLLYALDEQVRRYEVEGLVRKHEGFEFLGPVLAGPGGPCVGLVALDLKTMEITAHRFDAVVMATGGPGLVFGRSTNSMINTGSAASSCYQAGVKYANGEFIQIHPTAIPGEDKLRLMSESARGEGGRVWVPRKKGDTRDPREIPEEERWYFLEEKYPRFGNLVPRDIGAREIYDVCVNKGMGIGGQMMVYLDLTHKPREFLDHRLGAILEIYEKFAGDDPRTVPMKIFPAVHYSMGGLWVDYERTADGFIDGDSPKNHMTNIPGLYAAGECEYQYHGANRLGANALLSCIYSGTLAGPAAVNYASGLERLANDLAEGPYERERLRWERRFDEIRRMDGPENAHKLHRELGELMIENMTIVRHNDALRRTDARLQELMERWHRIGAADTAGWTNQELPFINQLWNMLELARVMTLGALARDESRGAHYKPEFPERNDEEWLKTTIAEWTPDGPKLSYEEVDTSLVKPVARKYD
ncbi:MAG: succinate dehydrogenase flavoprotein subunit [Acidobacteria bacterium]|nr:MAG: succinate dehydrogenase flavoprotein subunit [Acidobacteriota bacterium]